MEKVCVFSAGYPVAQSTRPRRMHQRVTPQLDGDGVGRCVSREESSEEGAHPSGLIFRHIPVPELGIEIKSSPSQASRAFER